jgi:hypothetical protein
VGSGAAPGFCSGVTFTPLGVWMVIACVEKPGLPWPTTMVVVKYGAVTTARGGAERASGRSAQCRRHHAQSHRTAPFSCAFVSAPALGDMVMCACAAVSSVASAAQASAPRFLIVAAKGGGGLVGRLIIRVKEVTFC